MSTEMDYYGILGVLPTADDCVIRAAHRVLTQKYRSGRTPGGADETEARMAVVEDAFRVLSDPGARAEYDQRRSQTDVEAREYGEQEASEDLLEESGWRSDWELASRFYPELKEVEAQFSAISAPLAFTFCAFLLETKRFPEATGIAREMEQAYLGRYFGEDPEILAFAKDLIVSGNTEAVRTLGRALRVLGSSTPARVIIDTLSRDLSEGTLTSERHDWNTEQETEEPPQEAVEATEAEVPEPPSRQEANNESPARESPLESRPPPPPEVPASPPPAVAEGEKAGAALLKGASRMTAGAAKPPAAEPRDSGPRPGARDPKTRAAVQGFLRMYRAGGGLDVDSAVVLVRALGGTVDSKKPGTLLGEAGIEVVFRGQRINFGPDDFLQWAERKLLPEALAQR